MLVNEATAGLRWLHSLGLKYRLMYERQAYEREDGSNLFWGGLHVGNVGGGEGLMHDHVKVAGKLGIEVRYGQDVFGLLVKNGAVKGVRVRQEDGSVQELRAESVIGAGGFESNPVWRREHLGEGWENAKGVRHSIQHRKNARRRSGSRAQRLGHLPLGAVGRLYRDQRVQP